MLEREIETEGWEGAAPFSHLTVADFSDAHVFERVLCGSFLYFPNETARLWATMAAKIENPGTALIRDERNRLLVKKVLEFRKQQQTRTGNSDPQLNLFEFCGFCGKDCWLDMGGSDYVVAHSNYFWSLTDTRVAMRKLIEEFQVVQFQNLLGTASESVATAADLNSVISMVTEKSLSMLQNETAMITPTVEVVSNELDRKITEDDVSDDIPTAFRSFANFVGEYKRGQITLVGAPPGNGKTAWAMQEIQNALMHGFVVDAFLMESTFQQFTDRWIMRNYAIRGSRFKGKQFTQDEYKAINDGMGAINGFENRLHLAPMANYSVGGIDAMLQGRKAANGLPCDFIVIDHLDCMDVPVQKGQGKFDAVKDAVLQIRSLAARENAAVLLLSQLSVDAVRNAVGQGNKFPTIDAFRGGTPTEAAKVVVILNKDKQAMLDENPVVEQQIVVCKANDGQTGYVRSLFLKPYAMHIEDSSPAQRAQNAKWLNSLQFPMDSKRKDVSK